MPNMLDVLLQGVAFGWAAMVDSFNANPWPFIVIAATVAIGIAIRLLPRRRRH